MPGVRPALRDIAYHIIIHVPWVLGPPRQVAAKMLLVQEQWAQHPRWGPGVM